MKSKFKKDYIELLIDSLLNARKYNDDYEMISKRIFDVLNKDEGRIFIVAAGTVASEVAYLNNSFKYLFKFNKNKFVIIRGAEKYKEHYENMDELIYQENIPQVGILHAKEEIITSDDIVISLSSTGRTKYINSFMTQAINDGAYTICITSLKQISDNKIIADKNIELVITEKKINGLFIGNHTTLLKVIIEKILFRVFEMKGQIYKGNILTTKMWTQKLRDNSFGVVSSFNPKLSNEKISNLFAEADNELSTVITSIILDIDLKTAKEEIEKVNYDFTKISS